MDISTPSAVTATLRRNLMEFFDENSKEFVPGGGTVIYLDSQDPLKMTLGIVFTYAHNGQSTLQQTYSVHTVMPCCIDEYTDKCCCDIPGLAHPSRSGIGIEKAKDHCCHSFAAVVQV